MLGWLPDLDYLRARVREARDAIRELERIASRPYGELSLDEKYSMRYQVIVLVEAVGGLCLHIASEDFGYRPESYGECFRCLGNRGIVRCADDLIRIVRLRNLLVHRYWLVDDLRVYNAVKENFKCILEFLGMVEEKYGL